VTISLNFSADNNEFKLQSSSLTKSLHLQLIPLYVCVGVGMLGAFFYTVRLATRNPDVTWNRGSNPEPWQEYANKQYKVRKRDNNKKNECGKIDNCSFSVAISFPFII
jgi:NADH dehydrogenase (ubiquinone) 1 alpha subcomplex subunit 4